MATARHPSRTDHGFHPISLSIRVLSESNARAASHLVAAKIVIGEVIARVRLVDDLDHAVDRIHLGAGNVNALRRNDGRARRAECWFIEACPKLILAPSSH